MPRDINGKPVKPEKKEKAEQGSLVHMERSEKKEGETEYSEPDYSYGHRLHLNHDDLKKLGHHDHEHKAGDEVEVHAKGHIAAARSEEREGKTEQHLEIQLTHMGVSHKADGMKSEAQGGKGKAKAGHVSERKRH